MGRALIGGRFRHGTNSESGEGVSTRALTFLCLLGAFIWGGQQ